VYIPVCIFASACVYIYIYTHINKYVIWADYWLPNIPQKMLYLAWQMSCTCSPIYSGGWGRRIDWAQEFKTSLSNTARPLRKREGESCIILNLQSVLDCLFPHSLTKTRIKILYFLYPVSEQWFLNVVFTTFLLMNKKLWAKFTFTLFLVCCLFSLAYPFFGKGGKNIL
jgi:hypothetical protein